jgi:adenosylhomocysteine nucleosidase
MYSTSRKSALAKKKSISSLKLKITMKIGILVAMEKEMEQLQSFFTSPDIMIRQSGIGKVNAALTCLQLIQDFKPDVIISTGCAGGNGEGVHVGDVVVSKETAYHDVYCGDSMGGSVYGQIQGLPPRFTTSERLVSTALQLNGQQSEEGSPLPTIHAGLIVTGDWFVDSKEKMQDILSHFPEAKAVEMESAAIAHTCFLQNIPFVSFRVVSDMPMADEHASQYHDFWKNVSIKSFSVTKSYVNLLLSQD